MFSKTHLVARAAIATILGTSLFTASQSHAAESSQEKGHCIGANACKGKGGCAQEGKNACAGKNGCGGKGFIEATKAECDLAAKKNSKVRFQSMSAKKHE